MMRVPRGWANRPKKQRFHGKKTLVSAGGYEIDPVEQSAATRTLLSVD
jgi:hypothetical protein